MASLNDALQHLINAARASKIVSTNDIRAERRSDGTRLTLVPKVVPDSGGGGGGGTTAVPCIVTGGSGFIYDVNYVDPNSLMVIGTGTAMPIQLNFFYTIPVGTEVMALTITMAAVDDGDGVGG